MRAGKPMVLTVRMIALPVPVRKSVKNHLIFSQIRVIIKASKKDRCDYS